MLSTPLGADQHVFETAQKTQKTVQVLMASVDDFSM
jgi:hypothetical protein